MHILVIICNYVCMKQVASYIHLLYKAEKPSVCPSVRLYFWHADNSAVSTRIETGLAQSKSCVFGDHKVYFYKPIVPTFHRQEYLEDEGVSSH